MDRSLGEVVSARFCYRELYMAFDNRSENQIENRKTNTDGSPNPFHDRGDRADSNAGWEACQNAEKGPPVELPFLTIEGADSGSGQVRADGNTHSAARDLKNGIIPHKTFLDNSNMGALNLSVRLLEGLASHVPNQTARKDLLWLAHQGEMFNEGVMTGAVLNPVNGVTQLVDRAFGLHIPALKFDNQKDVNRSIAGNAGTITGTVIDMVAAGEVMGPADAALGLSGAGAAAFNGSIIGGLYGGVLTPTAEPNSGHFWRDRGENALLGAGFGALMGASGFELNGIASKVENTIASQAIKYGAGFAMPFGAGVLRAEVSSLLHTGKPASKEQLKQSGKRAAANTGVRAVIKGLESLLTKANVPDAQESN
jgi:hypothetical protein